MTTLEFVARFFIICKLQTYTRKINLQAVDESMYINLSIDSFIDVIFGYNYNLSQARRVCILEADFIFLKKKMKKLVLPYFTLTLAILRN